MTEEEIILKEFLRLLTKYNAELFVTMEGDVEFLRKHKEDIQLPRNVFEAKEMIKEIKLRK